MKLQMEITYSLGKTAPFEYIGPRIQIGRDPTCELAFQNGESQGISWNHALIELTPDGAFVRDLESSNGTFVNDKRIEKRTRLETGDHIRLGREGPYLKLLLVDLSGAFKKDKANAAITPSVPPATSMSVENSGGVNESAQSRPTLATRVYVKLMEGRYRKFWIGSGIGATCFVLFFGVILVIQGGLIGWLFGETKDLGRQAKGQTQRIDQLEYKVADAMSASMQAQYMSGELNKDVLAIKEAMPANGREIHQKVVRTNVFISAKSTKNGQRYRGSGSVIDREAGLILTAHHVIRDMIDIRIIFPEFRSDGAVIPEREHYTSDFPAKLLTENSGCDLAIVQVATVPSHIRALPLAKHSPSPGDRVHTVGNPGVSAAFWVYTSGSVRQVIHKTVQPLDLETKKISATYVSWMIEFQNPINGGDSGGPVVNEHAELVGVNSTGLGIALVSNAIDIREVRALLKQTSVVVK